MQFLIQSDMETDSSSRYPVVQFRFKIIIIILQEVYVPNSTHRQVTTNYWAVQVGLLTPLTFDRHHLSPLAAFTSGAYFLHNGRR